MRVLYLLNHAGKAGTERYVYSLIESLHGKNIEAFFAYNEDGLLVEKLNKLGVKTFHLRMRHPFDINASMKLAKLCKNLRIDLIHTQFLRENYIAMLSRIFYNKVKVMHTSHIITYNNLPIKIANAILTPLEEAIISVCTKGREQLIANWINPKKISIIFNGIDYNEWGTPIQSTIRAELGIPAENFVFYSCSRFSHEKGMAFLVRGMAELKKIAKIPFACVLSNDGPLLDETKNMVKELGLEKEVVFIGFRQDMKNILYGCDVFLNTSENEALSFAIVEALGCGVPVIATNVGGTPDIINDSTNCGELVQYDNSVELANVANGLMSDEKRMRELRQNSLRAAKEIFGLDLMIDKTYNIMIKAVKR